MDGRIMMKWGYLRNPYYEYGTKLPLLLPMDSHKHLLITGSTGSGKSKVLSYLFWNFLSSIIHSQGYRTGCIHITFCDFKNYPTGEQTGLFYQFFLYFKGFLNVRTKRTKRTGK